MLVLEGLGFPGGSEGKASAYNVGDLGSIPELGRSPGEGNGNPLQYSCLENPMDRGAWQARVHGVERAGHDLATKPPPRVVNGVSDGKEFACNVGDPGSMPGSGRSSGERNGYPLQHSCLENSTDRGA